MSLDLQNSFRALADPTRREILHMLAQQDMNIGELVEKLPITRAAVKKHLVVLEEGQLISVHINGRERVNQLEPLGLKKVSEWVSYFDQYWDSRLSTLRNLLSNQ